jgi:hypothetical protein
MWSHDTDGECEDVQSFHGCGLQRLLRIWDMEKDTTMYLQSAARERGVCCEAGALCRRSVHNATLLIH